MGSSSSSSSLSDKLLDIQDPGTASLLSGCLGDLLLLRLGEEGANAADSEALQNVLEALMARIAKTNPPEVQRALPLLILRSRYEVLRAAILEGPSPCDIDTADAILERILEEAESCSTEELAYLRDRWLHVFEALDQVAEGMTDVAVPAEA